ncbi:hypothetical protein GQ42DRAFT_159546, partial [Ramicandelaber brevisporus]
AGTLVAAEVAADQCKCSVNGKETTIDKLKDLGGKGAKAVVQKLADKTPLGTVYGIAVKAADLVKPGEKGPPTGCADYIARFICKGRMSSCGRFRCFKDDEAKIKQLQEEWKEKHPDINCECGEKSSAITKEIANAVADAGTTAVGVFLSAIPGAGAAAAIGLALYKTRCGTCKCDGGRPGVAQVNPFTAKDWYSR